MTPDTPREYSPSKQEQATVEYTDRENLTISWRGIVLGTLTIVAWFYYLIIFMGINLTSSTFVLSQYPMVAVIPFVLWLFLNVLLKATCPQLSLNRGELLTIFSMTWIVGALPMWGWSDYWVAIMGAPDFMATSENQWDTIILPFLPWNSLPEPTERVIHTFWLGLPDGMPIPWDAWVGVLGRWLGASMAMVIFGLCLVIIFRKQWIESEKLTFPMAQMPLDLTRGIDGPQGQPEILHSRMFWIGFGIVFVPLLYNIITYFSPGLPTIGLYLERYVITLPQPFPSVMLRVLPMVLALVYLCPLNILGSLVLFYFLAVAKMGIMDQVGFSIGSAGQQLGSHDILDMESYGAIFCIAIWSVWLARRHLLEVWTSIVQGEGNPVDVRLYRLASIGMVTSGLYVIGFGVSLGASPPLSAATFILMATSFFVTIKLIAATGFPYLMPTWSNAKGGLFITDLVGSANLSTKGVVAFKLFISQAFFGNIRLPAWPAIPHHLRIFSLTKQPKITCAVVLIAFSVGLLVASVSSITVAYNQGGYIHLPYAFNVYPQIANLLSHPRIFDFSKWAVWLTGFLQAAALAYLRGRYYWFSLHPIGLAFQYSPGVMHYWFSLLLIWVMKLTLLHFGGGRAYKRGKPFFYGIGIGYVVGVVFSGIVDVVWFPAESHRVHYW